MQNTQEKLAALRDQMQKQGVDFYFVPTTDPHNNEYVPACWQRRHWISAFTGSAGEVLIGQDQAYLWVDGRYALQARQEVDLEHFTILSQEQGMSAPIDQWLSKNAAGQTVGIDPKVISASQATAWDAALTAVGGKLRALPENLVDAIWADRPALDGAPLFLWPEQHAGLSAADKISQLRAGMQATGTQAYAITALDAIAWLYNIRGNDIPYNPVAIAYALVTEREAFLFVDADKVTEDVRTALQAQHITVKAYDDFATCLSEQNATVFIESGVTSHWVVQQCKSTHIAPSLINQFKAIKNSTELAGMQEAHRQDGLALCRFFHWLEDHWQGQTEISVSDQLEAFRRESEDCRGLSFATISGFANHGAIIHYFATPDTDQEVNDQHLFLIDSGGQYWQGTTDVTRTVHLGTPTEEDKQHYTRVLKAHIALRQTLFPKGTTGEQLNIIAKREIWKTAMDYNHGTGHGVGCYLCVHEGPQRISAAKTDVALAPGMIVSNEPGLYIEGLHGVRVENLCAIEEVEAGPTRTGHGPFYGFRDLTLAPHARNLIDLSLITAEERDYINAYHQRVYDTLAGDLPEPIQAWLARATAPLAEV